MVSNTDVRTNRQVLLFVRQSAPYHDYAPYHFAADRSGASPMPCARSHVTPAAWDQPGWLTTSDAVRRKVKWSTRIGGL